MKIVCVGRNYAEHAAELGNEKPTEPVLFMKPASALNKSQEFIYPHFTNELHYECELVLRLSRNGKEIGEENALDYISGMTLGIDFTARDIQNELKKKSLPWERAKAFDGSAAIGIFSPVDKAKLQQLNFELRKNGETVQIGNTSQMIFSIPELLAESSNYFIWNIGDLLFTGTPKGVGECVVGDLLEGYLEGKKVLELVIK